MSTTTWTARRSPRGRWRSSSRGCTATACASRTLGGALLSGARTLLHADGILQALPEDDKKYLRVYYEVLDRYPREKFRHEEQQIRVLEQIRDRMGTDPGCPPGRRPGSGSGASAAGGDVGGGPHGGSVVPTSGVGGSGGPGGSGGTWVVGS